MISKRQREILNFIEVYTKTVGCAPSLEEIRKHFKLSSVSTIHFHVSKLKTEGYLKQEKNKARSISVLKKEQFIKIPLFGYIIAGEPIKPLSNKEYISVSKNKLPRSGKVYALQAMGDGMIDENMRDGDIVLIKQQKVAKNGQRVVASINNQETIIKRIYRKSRCVQLYPANDYYEPRILNKSAKLDIRGIVVDVIQQEKKIEAAKPNSIKVKKPKKTLPLNKIITGDAIAELKKLPDECSDVVIVDPPYNIGKDFGNNQNRRDLVEYVAWCKEWIKECMRVMKPNATMFIYGFSEILAHLSVEIPLSKRWLIWHYTNKNVASLNFWQRSHEAIICAWKDKPIFNRDDVREPYTERFLNGAAGKVRKATVGRFSKGVKATVYKAHERGALPRDVIKIAALAGGAGMVERWFLCKKCGGVFEPRELREHSKHEVIKHPTQKPFELSKKLIMSAMPKKEGVILVPFVGTGSECAAAKQLGQSYVGFEINPDYVKIAKKYVASVRSVPKLF